MTDSDHLARVTVHTIFNNSLNPLLVKLTTHNIPLASTPHNPY